MQAHDHEDDEATESEHEDTQVTTAAAHGMGQAAGGDENEGQGPDAAGQRGAAALAAAQQQQQVQPQLQHQSEGETTSGTDTDEGTCMKQASLLPTPLLAMGAVIGSCSEVQGRAQHGWQLPRGGECAWLTLAFAPTDGTGFGKRALQAGVQVKESLFSVTVKASISLSTMGGMAGSPPHQRIACCHPYPCPRQSSRLQAQ